MPRSLLLLLLRHLRPAALAMAAGFLPCAGHTAEAARQFFQVPAGEAAQTLKQYAAQAGREIVFAPETVRAVQTPAVRGEFTPTAALEALLTGTGLAASVDARTGAIAVRKEAARETKNSPGRPVSAAAAKAVEAPSSQESVVQLDRMEVTGSRLRGMLEGATAQPVFTLSSTEIDRTGAQSFGDLLRYIPQVSGFTTGQANTTPSRNLLLNTVTGATTQTASALQIDGSAGRTTATLRGSPAGGTLLLIDGRRAPKNNQARGNDGYDLNGIPLAAVDRIEVLLDGASSIYGADAMGGVINVILKKNYRGTELRTGYENTFDRDAAVISASLAHGFGAGKLSGMVTLNWEKSNTMAMRDRDFTASWDRRPWGGADLRPAIPGGTGQIARSPATSPLPGLTTATAALPANTTGANLTVADFAAAGPIAGPLDLGQYTDFAATYRRHAALVTLGYRLHDSLEPYLELRTSRNQNTSRPQPLQARLLPLPAGFPGNPFGVPITLSRYFLDRQPERVSTDDTTSAVAGLRGQLPRGWSYDVFLSNTRGHTRSNANAGTDITAAALNAAIAAGRAPNLFYDSTRMSDPNAPGTLDGLTSPAADEEKDEAWTYQAQANGPVFTLPAGAIQLALGAERREEYTDFPLRLATDTTTARDSHQTVSAYFAEVNVPLAGGARRRPLLERLNLSGSYRRENYSDGGATRNPRFGVAWRPFRWLLARGSSGEGFKVPTLSQRNAPTTVTVASVGVTAASFDPLRGNTLNPGTATITRGGKPDLRPEKSENRTLGLVVDVPALPGVSCSFDYFDNQFADRIGTLLFGQLAQFFPERVTRGANLPTDPPGWAGVVTAADLRAVNINTSRTTGYDLGVRYDGPTPWGALQVALAGTRYTRNVFVPAPGQPPATTVNTDSLPVQINGSAFLTRAAWGAGVLTNYRAANRSRPDVLPTPAAIRWDLQFNYDFAKAAWRQANPSRWPARLLANTKASLSVFNVLNTRPPFDFYFMPDNSVLDSRLRRYGLSVRRQF